MKRILPFLIIVAVLGIALGSVWYLTKPVATSTVPSPNPPPASSGALPKAPTNQLGPPKSGVPGAEPAHTKGPPNAPAQIEEFGDFECPPCALFHPILEQMEAEFGDKLRVTFRHFPLPNHRHALRAASAAEAAGMQGKFWEMHKLIYEHQSEWKGLFDAQTAFDGYAKEIGLNVERFKRDLEGSQVAQRIIADGKRAKSLGVGGTPTVYLNGREVPFTHLPAEKLRVFIQQEIDNKK